MDLNVYALKVNLRLMGIGSAGKLFKSWQGFVHIELLTVLQQI
jgi:hypothetical protein